MPLARRKVQRRVSRILGLCRYVGTGIDLQRHLQPSAICLVSKLTLAWVTNSEAICLLCTKTRSREHTLLHRRSTFLPNCCASCIQIKTGCNSCATCDRHGHKRMTALHCEQLWSTGFMGMAAVHCDESRSSTSGSLRRITCRAPQRFLATIHGWWAFSLQRFMGGGLSPCNDSWVAGSHQDLGYCPLSRVRGEHQRSPSSTSHRVDIFSH
jgi:hypothetical protein